MSPRVRAVAGFKRFTDPQLVTTGRGVVKEMKDNPNFPNPPEENQNDRKIERVPQKTLRRHEATHEARHASSRPSIQTPRRAGEPSLDPTRQTAATVFRLAVRHELSYAVQHDYSMAPSIRVSGFHVCFCAMARLSDSRNSANAGRETELIGTGAPGAGR